MDLEESQRGLVEVMGAGQGSNVACGGGGGGGLVTLRPCLDTPKTLQDSSSNRILRHMHGTLNIDKKDN